MVKPPHKTVTPVRLCTYGSRAPATVQPGCAGVKGEAEAMCCKSRFSGADFSDLKREGAAHSGFVVVANHHKLLDTSHRGGCHLCRQTAARRRERRLRR